MYWRVVAPAASALHRASRIRNAALLSTSASPSLPDSYSQWFHLESLRSAALQSCVSTCETLLPCIPMTSLEHREKMMEQRRAMRSGSDKKAAERAGRRAAVLIPLCLKNGKPAVLFTVRSHNVSTHKGQVSFPGGHIEPGESSAAAAIREAREELGPGLGPINLVARGTAVPAITGTIVYPIVGLLERDVGAAPHEHLNFCATEVDRVFALTLDELHDPILQGQVSRQAISDPARVGKSGKWPVFLGEPQGAEVWGLTAFILDGILRKFLTPLRNGEVRSNIETSAAITDATQRVQTKEGIEAEERRRAFSLKHIKGPAYSQSPWEQN